MDLLSRREHSRKELAGKLLSRKFELDEIETALDKLEEDNLLNERRFGESYLNQRIQKGYGPVRIKQELKQKGIDTELAEELFETLSDEWLDLMIFEREKKFGPEIPPDYKEKMKQARFLQNRGFSPESVMRLFR